MIQPSLLERCRELHWQDLLRLFAKLLREAPDHTVFPARLLRERARTGSLPVEAIPALMACLAGAEQNTVIVELAKTLAAFGTEAEECAPILLEKIDAMIVSDDADFWAFDGCLHALGYLGNQDDLVFLDELESRAPVIRAGNLYKGSIPEEDRKQLFVVSIETVKQRLLQDDPGTWRHKVTSFQTEQQEQHKNTPAWMAGIT